MRGGLGEAESAGAAPPGWYDFRCMQKGQCLSSQVLVVNCFLEKISDIYIFASVEDGSEALSQPAGKCRGGRTRVRRAGITP